MGLKYAVNATDMKRIDRYTIDDAGVPSMVLMERAALCVADTICGECLPEKRIVAVCGNGNNGGDGIAVARILFLRGRRVSIYMCTEGRKLTEETQRQLDIAIHMGVPIDTWFSPDEYTVIIDALLGTGLSREVSGSISKLIGTINSTAHDRVYAVDIPSGISATNGAVLGNAVRADVTVTFGYNKTGLMLYPGREYARKVVVVDIGFAPQAVSKAEKMVKYYEGAPELPGRSPDANKGSFGRVVVIAGHGTMCGSAVLAARAAFRVGAGLVRVITSQSGVAPVLSCVPEAMVESYERDEMLLEETITSSLGWATAVVFGMGIGTDEKARRLFELVIKNVKVPLVLDADGLNVAAGEIEGGTWMERAARLDKMLPRATVLTPHIKELSRLLGCDVSYVKENIIDIAFHIAYNGELIYVCKDAATVTAAAGSVYINASGNCGMATAGSGDVLAGVIGGLIACGMEYETAGACGAYIHGLAGDDAAALLGIHSMMAGDIVSSLSKLSLKMR